MAISNRYQDIFKGFFNSLDKKSSNMQRLDDKELRNVMPGFTDSPTELKLDKNFSDGSQ